MAPMEKNEIIDAVIQSGKIDIISSPNPIEYESIAVLRAMSISQLKKAMTDAGVFFDSKFVVRFMLPSHVNVLSFCDAFYFPYID
jgi:hypothetical protein